MRLPNGYGSVYKLPGKRRRPWVAAITTGRDIQAHKQTRKVLGYFGTRQEALNALAEYNKDPYDIITTKYTFSEIYEKWRDVWSPGKSDNALKAYRLAYNRCTILYNMPITDIKPHHLQRVLDSIKKAPSSIEKTLALFNRVFDFAVKNGHIRTSPAKNITLPFERKNAPDEAREPFTAAEIKKVWEVYQGELNYTAAIVLMLIYCGCRISELLNLKKEDIHLAEQWFLIRESKTEAGTMRKVPIANKVLGIWKSFYSMSESEYIILTSHGRKMEYGNFKYNYWAPLMEQLNMDHTPHETRHTFITLMHRAGVDKDYIQIIVGHKIQGITAHYDHIDIEDYKDEVNKIQC